jgi:hypothetical protein
MRRIAAVGTLAAAIALSGCYHATIDTGKAPAPETISKAWAPGFIFGLVPPPVTETAGKCPNGVSKVETRLSFLNQVASGVTFGLYTPMRIDVTCAK